MKQHSTHANRAHNFLSFPLVTAKPHEGPVGEDPFPFPGVVVPNLDCTFMLTCRLITGTNAWVSWTDTDLTDLG